MRSVFALTRRCSAALALDCPSSSSSLSSDGSSQIKPVELIPVYLNPSSNPRRKPSFYIPRMRDETTPNHLLKADSLGTASPLFTISAASCEYYALRLPLLKAGFKRVIAPATLAECNLIWGRSMPFRTIIEKNPLDGRLSSQLAFPAPQTEERAALLKVLSMTRRSQRFNHYPLSHRNLGCKRGLTTNIRRLVASGKDLSMADTIANMYRFEPKTWMFPMEQEALTKHFAACSPTCQFIWKPARGSCGRGIFISAGGASNVRSWERVIEEIKRNADGEGGQMYKQYVVQEYLDKPLLLDGRKADLRLYVAVTSYDPLVVYLHEDGLVRLAAEKYKGSQAGFDALPPLPVRMEDMFKHLTNYSVGRKYSKLTKEDKSVGASQGSPDPKLDPVELKWSLSRLWEYIDARYAPTSSSETHRSREVQREIALVIIRTLMAVSAPIRAGLNQVQMSGKFFEVYGFDIMLEEDLSPFLVEVNTLPSLESSSPFDYAAKSNMTADLLNLSLMEPFERDPDVMRLISMNKNLTSRPSSHMLPYLHTLHEQNLSPSLPNPPESKEDLYFRLEDEAYASRGFQRIFPPYSSQMASHPLVSESKAHREDLKVYQALNLLSTRDAWSLAY